MHCQPAVQLQLMCLVELRDWGREGRAGEARFALLHARFSSATGRVGKAAISCMRDCNPVSLDHVTSSRGGTPHHPDRAHRVPSSIVTDSVLIIRAGPGIPSVHVSDPRCINACSRCVVGTAYTQGRIPGIRSHPRRLHPRVSGLMCKLHIYTFRLGRTWPLDASH